MESKFKELWDWLLSLDITDSAYNNAFVDMEHKAIDYSQIRANWKFVPKAEKQAAGDNRTAGHNAVIETVQELIRQLEVLGYETDRFNILGDCKTDRKVWGDWGCYVAYRLGIAAR